MASLNQKGVEREGSAAFAAGIAAAFDPNSDVNDVIDTIVTQADGSLYRSVDITLAIGDDTGNVDAFTGRFYEERLDWTWPGVEWDYDKYDSGERFSGSVIEILSVVVGLLALTGDEPNAAIVESANYGRRRHYSVRYRQRRRGNGQRVYTSRRLDGTIREKTAPLFDDLTGDEPGSFEAMATYLLNALNAERRHANERAAYLDAVLD